MTGEIVLIFVVGSGVALLAWHLVRPNFRDLRISMAEFLPDLQQSSALRGRISLVPPIASPPFLLRMLVLAAMVAALWSSLLPRLPDANNDTTTHLRIVLDLSPSMGLGSRLDSAAHAIDVIRSRMEERHPNSCIDIALVGETIRTVEINLIDVLLTSIRTEAHGIPASSLLSALELPGGKCTSRPTHGVMVTDLPPTPNTGGFDGVLAWWQLGSPLPNFALTGLHLTGIGLGSEEPSLIVSAYGYGSVNATPTLSLTGPSGKSHAEMRPDVSRTGSWTAELPYSGAGIYEIALNQGGAYEGDDRVRTELPDLLRPAVDWQFADLSRPPGLSQGNRKDTLVTGFVPTAIPSDRPALLLYDGWRKSREARIGFFFAGTSFT